MNILDRYVARSFLSSFAILLAVFIGLYILIDLTVNIDDFLEHSVSTGQLAMWVVDYYGCNLPLYFAQLCGPVMALAAAFTFGFMLRNNELTALIAAGVPLQRLIAPLIVCAILLVSTWAVTREWVIPALATQIVRDRQDITGARADGVYCVRDGRGVSLTALRLLPRSGRLENVFIIEPRTLDGPATLVQADAAEFDPAARAWRLERGRRLVAGAGEVLESGAAMRYEPVDAYPFPYGPDQLRLRQSAQWSELLSLRDFNALLASQSLANRPTLVMGRHVRLTQPMLQFILLLLPAAYFLTREPAHVLAAGGRALLLAGLFFAFAFGAHAMSVDERWTALVAWLPILVFVPVTVLRLANIKT